jgi:hypothetical protein
MDTIATPNKWAPIYKAIDDFVEDYEMYCESEDGHEGFYTPTTDERYMIKDAIMDLLADANWLRAVQKLSMSEPGPQEGGGS